MKSESLLQKNISPLPVMVAPLQIKTLGDLCSIYGKTKETIKRWYQEGAPINFDGANYSADYHSLETWRLSKFSNFRG